MSVELHFPNTSTRFFNFTDPDPYKDADQDMSEWYVEVNRTDAPQWKWKMEEEGREYEEEMRKYEEEAQKEAELREKINKEISLRKTLVTEWIITHEAHLKQVIYNVLLTEEPKVAQVLGELESVELEELLSITDDNRGYELLLHFQFENFPKEKASIETYIKFDDSSFTDINKGGEMSFYDNYFKMDFDVKSKMSEAIYDLTEDVIVGIDIEQGLRID